MSNFSIKFFFTLIYGFLFFTCEKDDICISSVDESPDLVILLLDSLNPKQKKSPYGFTIRAIGNEKPLRESSGDSLALPLNFQENATQFEFVLNVGSENENIDTLQINYMRIDKFINKACGYRANFILQTPPVKLLNSGNNWIKGFTILKDTISDEKAAHLGILH
jgi:hypothetical protein|tara:strand:+ start:3628 stop:4122 length:495 start_codon:yes stop_codon:yes gene_type:complete